MTPRARASPARDASKYRSYQARTASAASVTPAGVANAHRRATSAARRAWAASRARRAAGRFVCAASADGRDASGHDREPGQGRRGQLAPGPAEGQEQRPAHEPRRGEAEALRTVVRERPRRRRGPRPPPRRRGPRPLRGRAAARRAREAETQGENEQHLGPIGPDAEQGETQGAEEDDGRVPLRPLLARRARGEEGGERHEAARRHLEALGPEVGRVPGPVEEDRAGEGERRRLRPRLAAVEPHGARAEEEQVGEEAHGAVLAGREKDGGEVAADPRERRPAGACRGARRRGRRRP